MHRGYPCVPLFLLIRMTGDFTGWKKIICDQRLCFPYMAHCTEHLHLAHLIEPITGINKRCYTQSYLLRKQTRVTYLKKGSLFYLPCLLILYLLYLLPILVYYI